MKAVITKQNDLHKRLTLWAIAVAGVLAIPFVTQAPWSPGDYIFGGAVLFGAACAYELISHKLTQKTHKILVGIAVAAAVMLVWAWAVS